MKSDSQQVIPASFYLTHPTSGEAGEWLDPTRWTAGPWSPEAQHGGPPAALLARGIERVTGPDRVIGRFTMDLLGPVPVAPLALTARELRPGRSVALVASELADETGRTVARGQAWVFPVSQHGPGADQPPGHSWGDGEVQEPPPTWSRGYLDAIEWRWVAGRLGESGPATVWMRPRAPLVAGEPTTPVQRMLTCVDSASGASSALDIRTWAFLNTELTVNVLRPPVGEWICLVARTDLGTGSVGVATSKVYDEHGFVGRSSQTLLVVRR